MAYCNYLTSPEWIEKREKRKLIDGKCAICGKPYDLQVHHLTYENVPDEKTTDLVTLCRPCHIRIENMKRQPGSDSFNQLNILLQYQFCKEHKKDDLSGGGRLDFCKYDVIKKHLFPYLKEHTGNAEKVSGCLYVQEYFRNRRYEIILEYMEKGYPQNIVYNRTLFSRTMIAKVYEKPEQAKDFLQKEKEKFEELAKTEILRRNNNE